MTDYLSIEGAKLLNRNAERLDTVINSDDLTYADENGITRYTVKGYEALASPDNSEGLTFAVGGTLTRRNQVVYKSDGSYWQWNGTLPKTWAAGFDPTTNTGSLAWINKNDLSIRSDLNQTSGATLVKTSTGATVEARLSSQDTSIAGKAALAGSSSQTFSVADASSDTQAASYGQVKSRTKKGGLTQSILSNALTLNYAARLLQFRNATLTNGTSVEIAPSADMGLTLPSGCSLGGVSGIPLEFFVLGIYNGGSPVIGVVNANGGLALDESGLISTTAISATSTSASTIYTTSAVTNSPYVILARLTVTLPTAGAWSVLPTATPIDMISVGMMSRRLVIPAIATTSGSAIDQAIPSWARRITILFAGVSTSGTSLLLVRLGTPTIATAGYASSAFNSTSQSVNNTSNTTGFVLMYSITASATLRGSLTLISSDGVSWVESSIMSDGATTTNFMSSGSVTISSLATLIRLTTVNGTDTFDAGSISFLIEG